MTHEKLLDHLIKAECDGELSDFDSSVSKEELFSESMNHQLTIRRNGMMAVLKELGFLFFALSEPDTEDDVLDLSGTIKEASSD